MVKLKNLFTLGKTLLTLTIFSIASISCSSIEDEYYSAPNSQNISNIQNNTINTSNNNNSFIQELSRKKITLNNQELSMVVKLKNVEPAGRWTPGPEENPEANMKKHFEKHGHDFKPVIESLEEYFEKAMIAAKSPDGKYYFDTKPYLEERIVSLVKWNSQTKEFTVTRDNGQIATYFINMKVKPERFVKVPEDFGNEQ